MSAELVLVSGASGFIAVHCCLLALKKGYRVRGTVRSSAKGEYLTKLLNSDKFEYVIVEDIEAPGAFDKAVVGCDHVLHTASPFHFRVTDPHVDLINPAVRGTVGMLESAIKEAKIKTVVITSSYASVVNPTPDNPSYAFTEKDWNTFSPIQVEKLGNKVDGVSAYRTSKVEAEKAAWAFLKEHTVDGKAPFSITCVNPPLVFGPILQECNSAAALNTSVGAFYAYLTGAKTDNDATLPSGLFVDVRDVAQIHVEALTTKGAANNRFLVSNSNFSYQPLLDIMHAPANAALLAQFPKAIRGVVGSPAPVQPTIDTTFARTTFGWTPIPVAQTIVDMAQSLAERQKAW